MAARIYVRPGWVVVQDGVCPKGGHLSDGEALRAAITTIRSLGGGEIQVLNESGKITEQLTITPRKDSCRLCGASPGRHVCGEADRKSFACTNYRGDDRV